MFSKISLQRENECVREKSKSVSMLVRHTGGASREKEDKESACECYLERERGNVCVNRE